MTNTSAPPTTNSQDSADFADRLFNDALGAFNIFAVHIGDRLGWTNPAHPRSRCSI